MEDDDTRQNASKDIPFKKRLLVSVLTLGFYSFHFSFNILNKPMRVTLLAINLTSMNFINQS